MEASPEFPIYFLNVYRRERRGRIHEQHFVDEVATLYRLLGFEVQRDVELGGVQVAVAIQERRGGLLTQAIVECQDARLTPAASDRILVQHHLMHSKLSAYRWIVVASQGFEAEVRTALENVGISCVTYPELLHELVPLDRYVEQVISEFEMWVAENWRGEDWFIRPDVLTDISIRKTAGASAHCQMARRYVKGLSHAATLRTGDLYAVVQHAHALGINAVAYNPDGELLARSGNDGLIMLYRSSDGRLLRVLQGHTGGVWAIAFAPDGTRLASGSWDQSVRLWEVASGQTLRVLQEHLGPVSAISFAPNGKYLVTAGTAGRLQFWDVETGETFLSRYVFGPGAWLDLLPDGRFDASPEGMRCLCYTERGTLNSFTAEELVKEFYDPQAVRAMLEKYVQ